MRQAIEAALQPLLGLPLWTSRRAADLQGFHFGERRKVVDDGEEYEVGSYTLHVQCAWRIRSSDSILVGSADLYQPASSVGEPDTILDFQWERQGVNLRDERIDALFGQEPGKEFVVRSVAADNVGGIRIDLSDDIVLEVFPDASYSSENWRLFQPWNDQEHFVVTSQGVEE